MTAGAYQAALTVFRKLVRDGYRPDIAADVVNRAVRSGALNVGLGKVQQMRRNWGPRPAVSPGVANQCATLRVIPGAEAQLNEQITRYESQGFTVMRVSPYKGHEVVYACPPGQLPLENQPALLRAEVF